MPIGIPEGVRGVKGRCRWWCCWGLFPLDHARRLEADFADARRDERSQHIRDARSPRRTRGKDHRIRTRHHEQREGDQAATSPASEADRCSASPTRAGKADDRSREDHQVPHRTLPITLGPACVAARAGIDVRAVPASNLVASERGHGSSLRDVGCSELGDRLKETWSTSGSHSLEAGSRS
jgi:hypothetical protein